MKKIEMTISNLKQRNDRSKWKKGVNIYALELMETVSERAEQEGREPSCAKELEKWALNGAVNWSQYSWGGSALVYNGEIAERLCTPSELKKTHGGERRPNRENEWLDVQASALRCACIRIMHAYNRSITCKKKGGNEND